MRGEQRPAPQRKCVDDRLARRIRRRTDQDGITRQKAPAGPDQPERLRRLSAVAPGNQTDAGRDLAVIFNVVTPMSRGVKRKEVFSNQKDEQRLQQEIYEIELQQAGAPVRVARGAVITWPGKSYNQTARRTAGRAELDAGRPLEEKEDAA